jgi:chromosome transmission fidelity protein 4
MRQLNFAHLPGNGGMAVSLDGLYTLTGSGDCALRVHDICATVPEPWWFKGPNHEPGLFELPATDIHEKPICGVAISADSRTFATACEDGFVRLFCATMKTGDSPTDKFDVEQMGSELVQACARFGAPVRAVAFSPTGAFLAAAGDEPGVVKVIMTAQPSTVNVMRADTGCRVGMQPIVALAYDPKSDFVATINGNGSTGVWSIESGRCLGALAVNDRNALCVEWAPDGSQLLVGTDNGAVFVQRDTWAFEKLLEDASGGDMDDDDVDGLGDTGSVKGSTSAGKSRQSISVLSVSWSKNGRYVLTARSDMSIRLWDATTMKILSVWQADCVAQSVCWHPSSNAFMVFDSLGQWGVVSDVVPTQLPSPYSGVGACSKIELPSFPTKKTSWDEDAREQSGDDDSGGSSSSDDEKDEKEITVRRSRTRRHRRSSAANDAGEEEDDEEDDGVADGEEEEDSQSRPDLQFDADDLDADEEEDAVALRRQREAERERRLAHSESEEERRRHRRRRRKDRAAKAVGTAAPNAAIPEAQSSFVPSSTKAIPGNRCKKHFLFWNLTAAVLSHDENSHNVVEVEFADKTRRTIGIKDHFGFSLGCVSETGVLLACPKSKEHSSILSFRPFASWSSNSDWIQSLAPGESALTIALGARFAAVASDQNVLRLFSLSGLQTDVFGAPGRVVTIAAAGNKLVVVYAASTYNPALRFLLYEISPTGDAVGEIANGDIVLSPNASLEWLGFTSDSSELVAYDSCGCVWLYHRSVWLPILQNAAKSADCDWLWIAAASSDAVVGAQCFGKEKYPAATPRPALRKVAMLAPVVEQLTKTGQSTIEERLFRARLRLSRAQEAKAFAEERYDNDDDEYEDAVEAKNMAARELDKCLLALMEVACRKEHNLRAFDIATRLSSCISLKFAVNLANHYKRASLAGRIEEIHRRRTALEAVDGSNGKEGLSRGPSQPSLANGASESEHSEPSHPSEPPRRQIARASPVTPTAPSRNGDDSNDVDSDDEVRISAGGPVKNVRSTKSPRETATLARPPSKQLPAAVKSHPVNAASARKRQAYATNRFAKRSKF